jgi:transcription elongation factor Elf1
MLCKYLQAAARREERKQVPREVVPQKTCPRCDKSKDSTEYYKDASGAGGLYGYCKSCTAVRVASKFQHNIVVYVVQGPLATIKDTPLLG